MSDKKEIHLFFVSEYEEEEKFLNEKAKEGYLLEKITGLGKYYFTKSEPVDMVYRIDFNPQKDEDRESYLQMFRDYGWEYIQDLNEFSYFCKVQDGSDDEIFSDVASRVDMAKRIFKRKMIPFLCVFLCILIPGMIHLLNILPLVNPIGIVAYLILFFLFVAYVCIFIRCAKGFRNLKEKYDL